MDVKERIARRAAAEINDGDVVNLGIGLPTLAAGYVNEDYDIVLQSENGILGMGGIAPQGKEDKNIINAGGQYVMVEKGASFFDSALSFGIIRGGHVDKTVLGALQVDMKVILQAISFPGRWFPVWAGRWILWQEPKRL